MPGPNFDLRGIEFETYNLSQDGFRPSIDTWAEILDLRTRAFREDYADARSVEEIDHWIQAGDSSGVVNNFKNPQRLVEGGIYNAGQTLWRTHLTVAFSTENGKKQAVGYLRTSDNTSGSHQAIKKWLPHKRYRVAGEIAVDPNQRERGIALAMAYGATWFVLPGRRSTAYALTEENPRIGSMLEWLGYQGSRDDIDRDLFGSGRPTHIYRYVAPAHEVAKRIIELPGAREAIMPIRNNLRVSRMAQLLLRQPSTK